MFPKFKTLEEIPESFRPLYTQVGEEWVVKPSQPKEDDDPSALKGALEKERTARKAEEKARKEAEDQARKVAQELKDARTALDAKAAGVTEEKLKELRDKVRTDLSAEFANELGVREARIKALETVEAENLTLKLDNAVKKEMLGAGVREERVDDLFRLNREHFELTDDGKPRLVKHPGKTVPVFIGDDLKKKWPEFFKGTQASGSDAFGVHYLGKPGTPTAEEVLANPAAAIAAARAGATP